VKEGKQWGILNSDNPQKWIASPMYDSLIYDYGNHDSPRIAPYFFAQRHKKWGIVSTSANIIVQMDYDRLDKISDTLLRACQGDSCFLINRKGERLCPCAYEIVSGTNAPFTYKEGKKYGLLDEQCRPITSAKFANILHFFDDKAELQDPKTKLYGFVDTKGEWLIEPKFKDLGWWEQTVQGKKALSASIDGKKYGYIDKKGNWLIAPQWYSAPNTGIATSIAGVRLSPKKYGYIDLEDPNFKVLIPAQFSDARHFYNGMALVRKATKWGLIDEKGAWIIPPQFNKKPNINENTRLLCAYWKGKWHIMSF
jgi:hypothetical protein